MLESWSFLIMYLLKLSTSAHARHLLSRVAGESSLEGAVKGGRCFLNRPERRSIYPSCEIGIIPAKLHHLRLSRVIRGFLQSPSCVCCHSTD